MMEKKRVLGQDPLTWIRQTSDTQLDSKTEEASPDVSATSPVIAPGAPTVIENIAAPIVVTGETPPISAPTERKEAMTEKTAMPQEKSQEERVVVRPADFETFAEASSEERLESKKMSLLMDLTLPVTVELGRTEMVIKNILKLRQGSMIELDKLAGEPVDLVINGRKLAEGEVVVIDEYFGIRITNLVETSEQELEQLRSPGGGR